MNPLNYAWIKRCHSCQHKFTKASFQFAQMSLHLNYLACPRLASAVAMTRILAIDLGKFKSVSCLLDTATNETEFLTMTTDRQYLLTLLKNYTPDQVVIESCGLAGWVHDICSAEGYEVLVCNPNQEAWKWKNVKRKTDRDDALKIAKLTALGQLVPVYIPCQQQREYRRLVKYRKVIVWRINKVQNNIRAIFAQRVQMLLRKEPWQETLTTSNVAANAA